MTGTTTQVMLDLADMIYARNEEGPPPARLKQMSVNVLIFALGCGAAALLYALFNVHCFVVPPVLGALALVLRLVAPPKLPTLQDRHAPP
jgi:uncharacterized membrane protein YoaK (UPF0700 family)